MQTNQMTLVRKQFLISESQVKKLARLAKKEHASAAEMVRQAIDAYDPDEEASGLEASELLELVHAKVKEAIASTKKANRKLSAGLKKLSKAGD